MSSGRTLTLNSGYSIPVVGLGTEVANTVQHALGYGYRHIDAAACYGNEVEVGQGIRASGVPRSDIFVTSKLWNTHHEPGDVEDALGETLKVRSIGVSNFTRERIQGLLRTVKMKPAVNQIEAHPYLQQPSLLDWLKIHVSLPIRVPMPASSIDCNNIYGKPRAIDDTVVVGVADNLGRQPAQAIDLVGSTARDGCVAKVGDAFKNRIQLQGF
ncbi:NADP-dependent oxidoreductase domain-containing protein [Hypoxylon argillaceum]|nr:NADP-dependent oxidoreductase domain-containing protein [Hypoxylon argillaceum]